jgi:cytochrome b
MTVVRILTFLLGGVLVCFTVGSAVKTVVVPRSTSSFITTKLFRLMRRMYGVLAHPKRSYESRDRILATFAPFSLVLLPGVWVALTVVGFSGVLWGLGGVSVREAFLTSGSSILTLGVLFHKDVPHAMVTFVEATIGLGLVSLMISYLPTMYSSFSRREQLVGMLEVRAGLPPSPAELLLRYHRIGWLGNISTELFPSWEGWFADIEESHTSHPALVYFRSPHPDRNWVNAAGVVLDTAALLLSVVDIPWSPQGALLIRSGSFSLRRVSETFRIPYDPNPKPTDPISVSRREFDLLLVELVAGGIPLKADREKAWLDFAGWRVNYDPVLVGLTRLVVAPPARWSSDRMVA